MRAAVLALLLSGLGALPTPAQGAEPHTQPIDHGPHQHGSEAASSHAHAAGPAGASYDLRWLDAMVEHHTGALRMSELVFNIGSPGVGALAHTIWSDQANEIKAMRQWRRAWYPEAPVYPVVLRPGGDPDSLTGLQRMEAGTIEAMRMIGALPSRNNRVTWFLEGMIAHHGGALEMAHDALRNTTNPTIRRQARTIIVAQSREIIALRRMLRRDGLNKPEYRRFDALFRY